VELEQRLRAALAPRSFGSAARERVLARLSGASRPPRGKGHMLMWSCVVGGVVCAAAAATVLIKGFSPMAREPLAEVEPVVQQQVAAAVEAPLPMPQVRAETAPPKPVAGTDTRRDQDVPSGKSGSGSGDDEWVPALPGVDYKISRYGPGGAFSVDLDAEALDPVWALEMERRLKEAVQIRPEFQGVRVEVVCRTTACGLLFVPSSDGDIDKLKLSIQAINNWAKGELGFASSGTSTMSFGNGRGYTQSTLSNRRGYKSNFPTFSARFGMPNLQRQMSNNEPVDRSPEGYALQLEIQKQASAIVGNSVSSLVVECRTTVCVVKLYYPPDVLLKSFDISSEIAKSVGLSTGLTGINGNVMTIHLRRQQ